MFSLEEISSTADGMSSYLIDPLATTFYHQASCRFGKMSHIVCRAMEAFPAQKCARCPQVLLNPAAGCQAALDEVCCESCAMIRAMNKWLRPWYIGRRATITFLQERVVGGRAAVNFGRRIVVSFGVIVRYLRENLNELRMRMTTRRCIPTRRLVQRLTGPGIYQICPNCSVLIERSGGCDHMTCRCGTHFCFVCGKNGSCGSRCITVRSFHQSCS
jgi:hypothetical protein